MSNKRSISKLPKTQQYQGIKKTKQRLQIIEALHIRNKIPKLNRINFKSSTNVLKCLQLLLLFIEPNFKINDATTRQYKW